MPFDSTDLLQEAGYEEGDYLPLETFADGGLESASDNLYQRILSSSALGPTFIWEDVFPDSVQTAFYLFGTADPSSDQIDVRLQNITDTETILERTGITGATEDIGVGPTDYRPTTTSGVIKIRYEIRNADGSTTVSVFDPLFSVGVRL